MHVTDFITSQFKKAGVELTAETKEVLNNPELTKVNLDDKLIKDVNEKLFTLDVAKQSPVLKQYFRAESLDPLDKNIETILTEYGLVEGSPELATAIRAEKSTYERLPMLAKAIKELEAKKATATVGDKKVLVEKIDTLDKEILRIRAEAKVKEDSLIAQNHNDKLEFRVQGRFSTYKYSKQYNPEDIMELGPIKLRKKLAELGGKVILNKVTGLPKLVNSADESLDFTIDNQKVEFNDFMDKFVAENKWIQTSDSDVAGGGTPPPALPGQPPNPTPGNDVIPNVAQADIMRELSNALGNGVPVRN